MALTPELRKGIDQIRNYLFGGGYPDPMSNAEQLSFLFFFYLIEGLDYDNQLRAKATKQEYKSMFDGEWTVVNPLNSSDKKSTILAERLRWSVWAKGMTGESLVRFVRDEVFPFYTSIADKSAMNFMDGARLGIDEPTVLTQVIGLIDNLRLDQADADTKGDLFEYVLKQIKQAGELGQFRTPRHVIRAVVEMVDPKIGETIYDPAAGTAGFLVAAYNHIRLANSSANAIEEVDMDGKLALRGWGDKLNSSQNSLLGTNTFYGNDVDPKMVRLATMNLTLRGLPNVHILKRNALTTSMDKTEKSELNLPLDGYDVVLANPPFSGSVDRDRIVDDVRVGSTSATEILFLKYMLNSIKMGGRCGVVVPEGILERPSGAHIELRRQLIENNEIEAIVSFPSGVFLPYATVKTSVIIFKKGGSTKDILFLNIENDGYKMDANHETPIAADDLPEIISLFENREKLKVNWLSRDADKDWHEKWWVANIEEINKGEFNLSANQYKPKNSTTIQNFQLNHDLESLIESNLLGDEILNSLKVGIAKFFTDIELNEKKYLVEKVRLKEVATVGSGNGFPIRYQGKKEGELPFYKVSDMNSAGNEMYMFKSNNYLSVDDRSQLRATVFPKETIIFPKIGAAIATNKKRILTQDSCFDNNVMGLIVSNKIKPLYLYALLLNKNISDFASDSNPPSIRKSKVEDWLINVPSIDVQNQFEEKFVLLVHLIKNQSIVLQNSKKLFDSFLGKYFSTL
jgi:type I restriction enzyme M protein